MTQPETIRFDNGATYDRYMGVWSRAVGLQFLEWLAPANGLRWLDVGCGNGAFTQLITNTHSPRAITGIDPSVQQIEFARSVPALRHATFEVGDAMNLPFGDNAFDIAVMPLVIFFVPEPAKGVAEMVRVVQSGGTISAYSWDMEGGGFPYANLQEELRAQGFSVPRPPNDSASRDDVLTQLWTDAGLQNVESRAITVTRTFADFDDYWTTASGAPSMGRTLADLPSEKTERLRARMKEILHADAGPIVCSARANAIKGTVR
ncbi:MAG: class I SAM-dependent methyltransferase [Gemmatimonas sp.]